MIVVSAIFRGVPTSPREPKNGRIYVLEIDNTPDYRSLLRFFYESVNSGTSSDILYAKCRYNGFECPYTIEGFLANWAFTDKYSERRFKRFVDRKRTELQLVNR